MSWEGPGKDSESEEKCELHPDNAGLWRGFWLLHFALEGFNQEVTN